MITESLFALQDLAYRDFQSKLMPTVPIESIIGVRTPKLRKFAKSIIGTKEADDFISVLPHKYYDENNLHGFIIEKIKDYDACVAAINAFLPYVDNWATCDQMHPKVFEKNLQKLYPEIIKWIKSGNTYSIRFGIEMLMNYYLNENFNTEHLAVVSSVRSDEYYVNMMIAWYFATALAKQYDATLPYIEKFALDKWTHNKSIQKAIESYRITDEQKLYLRTLKIK